MDSEYRIDLFLSFHAEEALRTSPRFITAQLALAARAAVLTEAQHRGVEPSIFDRTSLRGSLTAVFDAALQTRGGGVALFLLTRDFFRNPACLAELRAFLRLRSDALIKLRLVLLEDCSSILKDPVVMQLVPELVPELRSLPRCCHIRLTTLEETSALISQLVWDAWGAGLSPSTTHPTILGRLAVDSFFALRKWFTDDGDIPALRTALRVGSSSATETVLDIFREARDRGVIGYYNVKPLYTATIYCDCPESAAEKRKAIQAYERKWVHSNKWVWSNALRKELEGFLSEAEAELARVNVKMAISPPRSPKTAVSNSGEKGRSKQVLSEVENKLERRTGVHKTVNNNRRRKTIRKILTNLRLTAPATTPSAVTSTGNNMRRTATSAEPKTIVSSGTNSARAATNFISKAESSSEKTDRRICEEPKPDDVRPNLKRVRIQALMIILVLGTLLLVAVVWTMANAKCKSDLAHVFAAAKTMTGTWISDCGETEIKTSRARPDYTTVPSTRPFLASEEKIGLSKDSHAYGVNMPQGVTGSGTEVFFSWTLLLMIGCRHRRTERDGIVIILKVGILQVVPYTVELVAGEGLPVGTGIMVQALVICVSFMVQLFMRKWSLANFFHYGYMTWGGFFRAYGFVQVAFPMYRILFRYVLPWFAPPLAADLPLRFFGKYVLGVVLMADLKLRKRLLMTYVFMCTIAGCFSVARVLGLGVLFLFQFIS